MQADFAVCVTDMYQRKYIDFLLDHYTKLRLPYPFPVAFSFIASPILMERESFLCLDENGEAVGAFGYIHGTGEKDYEDRHVVQLQIAYLKEEQRGTRLFLQGMLFLMRHLEEREPEVEEVVFWTGAEAEIRRLADKFATLSATMETAFGELYKYRLTVGELRMYAARFEKQGGGVDR